jgi:hypothetical protein
MFMFSMGAMTMFAILLQYVLVSPLGHRMTRRSTQEGNKQADNRPNVKNDVSNMSCWFQKEIPNGAVGLKAVKAGKSGE